MSVRCCNVADETDGAEHDQWCSAFDFPAALAAAEARGYTRAVQALRDEDERIKASLTDKRGRLDWEAYEPTYDLAADHLEALTQQEGSTE